MSKVSYTSVYVKKIAPKFHNVLGYLTGKTYNENVIDVFKNLHLEQVDIKALKPNIPIPIYGNYDWMKYCLLGNYPAAILYYQISLLQQRLKFLKNVNRPDIEKISSIKNNPPPLILAISYPINDYPTSHPVGYCRGLIIDPEHPSLRIFAPCFPKIHGNRTRILKSLKELAPQLNMDIYKLIRFLFSLPKFLVALEPSQYNLDIDIMSMPKAYNVTSQTILLYPPQTKSEFIGNYTLRSKPFYTETYKNDFYGLEKYIKAANKKFTHNPNSLEDIFETKYLGKVEQHTLESLSEFLVEAYKSRRECHIYGLKFDSKIAQMRFMREDIGEHAKKELESFKNSRANLKNSPYSLSYDVKPKPTTSKFLKTKPRIFEATK